MIEESEAPVQRCPRGREYCNIKRKRKHKICITQWQPSNSIIENLHFIVSTTLIIRRMCVCVCVCLLLYRKGRSSCFCSGALSLSLSCLSFRLSPFLTSSGQFCGKCCHRTCCTLPCTFYPPEVSALPQRRARSGPSSFSFPLRVSPSR